MLFEYEGYEKVLVLCHFLLSGLNGQKLVISIRLICPFCPCIRLLKFMNTIKCKRGKTHIK